MSSGIAEHAARFSSLHAETLLLVQERQRARGLNLPTVAVEPTEALIANHVAVLADTLQEMASAVRVTDAAARSGRVALSEVRQAEDDLTEAKTSLESLLVMLGTDLWASELRAHTKSSCAALNPPPPDTAELPVENKASSSHQSQVSTGRPEYYHDDVEDDTEASAALIQSQQLQMDSQDAQLNLLGQSIQRQQHLSLQMNEELGRHSELLDNLDEGVDTTAAGLSSAHRRLDTFRRVSREHGSSFIIVGLIVLLILIIGLVK